MVNTSSYYLHGSISYDVKKILEALKEYIVLEAKLKDTIKDEALAEKINEARNSFNAVVSPHTLNLETDLKKLYETVTPDTEYKYTAEFDNAINLINAAGKDKMPVDVLNQLAERFKNNKAYIDLMISASKNIETKDFLERFKRNRVVDFDDALSAATYIRMTPIRSLEKVSYISDLFKRISSIDANYKKESEELSDLFFEIHSIYANGNVPVL